MIQCCNPERRSSPDALQYVWEETNVWGSKSLSYWSIWTVSVSIAIGQIVQVVMAWWLVRTPHMFVQLVAGGKQGRCTEHMRRPATSFALQTLHPVPARLIIVGPSSLQILSVTVTHSTVVWNIPVGIPRYRMIKESLRWWHSVIAVQKKSPNHVFPSKTRLFIFCHVGQPKAARPSWASANVLPKEMDEGNIHPGSKERGDPLYWVQWWCSMSMQSLQSVWDVETTKCSRNYKTWYQSC